MPATLMLFDGRAARVVKHEIPLRLDASIPARRRGAPTRGTLTTDC